jgi:hypothetical protein
MYTHLTFAEVEVNRKFLTWAVVIKKESAADIVGKIDDHGWSLETLRQKSGKIPISRQKYSFLGDLGPGGGGGLPSPAFLRVNTDQ